MNPLPDYLESYRHMNIDSPYTGEWARDFDQLPYALKARPRRISSRAFNDAATREIREAFYALSTHVDHQIRTIIGTLKEEGILDDTILMFTSDHGDMLGNHGLYTKMCFYEDSTNIPLVLVPSAQLEH
jgi:arylsulfatase A-like enzyme